MTWHARLSASQTKDWASCPGTIAVKEAFPVPDPSGKAAQLGTAAHALIERCLGEGVHPSSYRGRLIEVLEQGQGGTSILRAGAKWPKEATRVVFEVDDEMVDATGSFCEYVAERLAELFPQTFPSSDPSFTKEAVARGILKLEGRVNPLPERDDTGGTADVTIDAWPEVLEVVDYKNGTGVLVPVENNWQLRSYVLGRAQEAGAEYERYRYTVGQPRHFRAPQPRGISYEECTHQELMKFRDELRAACARVDRAREAYVALWSAGRDPAGNAHEEPTLEALMERLHQGGHLSTGQDGSHCTFCKLVARCPAAMARVEETAGADFDEPAHELEVPEGPNHLASVLPWLGFLEKYAKATRAHAAQMLRDGKQVPGYKLVQTKGDRTWRTDVDQKTVLARLASEFGLDDPSRALVPPPAPYEPVLLSGPKVEKLLPAKMRAAFSDALLYRPDGGISMVTEDDKRPAITPGAAASDDFPDEEDDGGE